MHKLVLACGLAFAATSRPFAFAVTSPPFAQDKIIERLGPVEVNEPVLGNIGPNALIAFYSPEDGKCAVQVVIGGAIMMKLIAFATSLFITNSHARAGDSMN